MLFDYVAWFRDPALPPEDQDYEWPACFIIDAQSPETAHEWGDRLARSYAPRARQVFRWSRVEPSKGDPRLPTVAVGEEASDQKIGW
jgi:hypothetical protein